MSYRNIALIGKAQAGKDTVAAHLVREYQFVRLAFADPLRSMALDINPYVPTVPGVTVRLRALIADVGWDYAKVHYPEVRRLLQTIGQGVREADPDFWLRILLDKVRNADHWNIPVVVTDVRYRNEADALRADGFTLVRVVRPKIMLSGEAARHSSERDLDSYAPDHVLYNAGSVSDLCSAVDRLVSVSER